MASKFAALALALTCVGNVWGATVQVATQPDLTTAIANASAGDTVQITAAGTYTLGTIPQNITIEGAVAGVVIDYSAVAVYQTFGKAANGASFCNMAFKLGSSQYRGWQESGKIVCENCSFEGLFFSYGDMEFVNCSFTHSGDYHMWVYGPSTVRYTGCTFTNTSKGKFINLYRENGEANYAYFTNCKFINQGSSSKSALNIKATCNAIPLTCHVYVDNCTYEGAFPAAGTTSTGTDGDLIVLDPLVQVDDIKANVASTIEVTFNGKQVYPEPDAVTTVEVTGTANENAEGTSANYTFVPTTTKGEEVTQGETQTVAVSVAAGDSADTTLAKFNMAEVLAAAIGNAGDDASDVTSVELLVKSTPTESANSISYEVHPEAVVTVSKTGEADSTSTVELSNANLAANATFTFDLDVSSITGIAVGDKVRVTHSWEAYTDAAGNSVAAGSETTLAAVLEGKKVRITTTHFSTWTLEGITIEDDAVAIVFAANGAEIDQYSSIADAIAAETTVNGCTVLVLDGEHDCGSETITINKEITLTGQSKAGTVLNFTATGKTAFSIQASNVTIKDMTINQADTGADTTLHVAIAYTGSYSNPMVAYSDITLQNLKFTGSKYSISVYAEDLTIDSCDFVETAKSTILLYCVKGTTRISNNTFVQTSPSGDGFIYGTTASGNDYSSGKLVISGNTATGGRVLYHCNNQNYFDATTKMTLEIVGNTATGYNNKAIVFAGHSDVSLASVFNSITITNNVLFTSALRPTIQRDDSDTSLEINAKYNYWGDKAPDYFKEIIPGSGDKMLVMGDNITYEPYYITYNSETGELSDLRPLPAVAQIGANKYETLAEAIAAVPTTGAETTITMIADSAEPAVITVASGKNVVLDLNGKTVSYTTDAKSVYFLTNEGTLTIEDNSANADGQILLTAQPDTGYSVENVTIYNCGGTLTLVSGTVKNATGDGLAYAVNNSSNAWGSDVVSTFNMQGGTVSAPGGDAALRVYQNSSASSTVLSKNYVNITGGTILDTGIFVDTNLHTANGSTEGFADSIDTQINISGGTVNGLIDMKIRHKNNTKLTITGGDFTNAKLWVRKVAAEYKGDEPTDPMVYISGGKFAFVAGKAFGLSYDCGATSWTSYAKPYAVSGGVFNVEVPANACVAGKTSIANTETETKDAYPYTVGVAVAQIGTKGYATLQAAINSAQTGDTVKLLADVDMTSYFTSSSTRFPISKSLTIDGQGHSITVGRRGFGVGMNASSKIDVTFKDVTIANSSANARCIDTRGNLNSLTLDHVTLDTNGASGETQPLTIGGNQSDKATVNIVNGSKIQTNDDATAYYAIITFNPVNMTITDSTIKGWACIYAKGKNSSAGSAGSEFTITDSVLESSNIYNGNSNAFSAIMIEDDDVQVNITGTEINIYGNSDQKQAVVGYPANNTFSESSVSLGEGNVVTLGGTNPNQSVVAFNYSGSDPEDTSGGVSVSGGTFNKEVPEDVCADGYIPAEQDPVTGLYTVKQGTYIAQIGTTKYETLAAAITAAEAGDTVKLLTDVTLTGQSVSGESALYGAFITKSITLDGNNHTIVGSNCRAIGVKGVDANNMVDVTFKNLTVTDASSNAICICTRGNIEAITLDNVTLDTTGCPSGYNQPLTIGGTQSSAAKVDIKNGSVIKTNDQALNYYAIIVWVPVDMTIDHSTVKGWACVYMKSGSAGSTVEITDSTLVSAGLSGSSNHFAALVTEADNVTMNVTGTEIDIIAASGTYQGILATRAEFPSNLARAIM